MICIRQVKNAKELNPMKVNATPAEDRRAREYFDSLWDNFTDLPLSFDIGDKHYHGFNEEFTVNRTDSDEKGSHHTTLTALYKDSIAITVAALYHIGYAAFEWTVTFENKGAENSPVLSGIKACDISMTGLRHIVLHHDTGDDTGDYGGFISVQTPLNFGMKMTFEGPLGRPTAFQFPYYKILHDDCGFFFAVGWPGQWETEFDTRGSRPDFLRLTSCQKEFSAWLKPGERIRTPLSVFLLFDGRDEEHSVNVWRRWFIDRNMRKINGGNMPHALACTTAYIYGEMVNATEKNQIEAFDTYCSHGICPDYWWMDAGWYFLRDGITISGWPETGSWIVDTNRFPTKFRAVSEHMGKYGTKTMLWFEPERTHPGTELYDDHPEWRLGDTVHADMGNPDYREWMLDRVFTVLEEGKIALYRQDWNIDPYPCWKDADIKRGDGRRGISENHYVAGFLAYWDAIIRRYPDMMIDSCASGGRRMDIESMRRAVPLHKTDADYGDFDKKQSMHYTLFKWIPYFGTLVTGWKIDNVVDAYSHRSAYVGWSALGYDFREAPANGRSYEDVDWIKLQGYVTERRLVMDNMYGDYYMLTPYASDRDDSVWIGWEIWDDIRGEGFITMFRRKENNETDRNFCLRGLDDQSSYRVVFHNDDGEAVYDEYASGKILREKGIRISISDPRGSAIIRIIRR